MPIAATAIVVEKTSRIFFNEPRSYDLRLSDWSDITCHRGR